MAATTVILALSKLKRLSPGAVILAGVALSSLFVSGTILIQYFATEVEVATIYPPGRGIDVVYGGAAVLISSYQGAGDMMLSILGVRFSYNGHPVLREIQLELDQGQILAVLGVNGAGKSTFLKCINRILRVKKGHIRLHSDDVLHMRPEEIASHMGYVPQRYGEEDLSVFDAVLLGRKPYMKWKADQQDLEIVETTLRQMALAPMAMRPVNTLSGGDHQEMARRVRQEG